MKTQRTVFALTFALAAGLGALALVFAGCQSTEKSQGAGQPPDQVNAEPASAEPASTELSGAQLWAQTCAHCHNSRSPASYNDAKWGLTVNHMRQQAYLTGDQSRKILEFLRASN